MQEEQTREPIDSIGFILLNRHISFPHNWPLLFPNMEFILLQRCEIKSDKQRIFQESGLHSFVSVLFPVSSTGMIRPQLALLHNPFHGSY